MNARACSSSFFRGLISSVLGKTTSIPRRAGSVLDVGSRKRPRGKWHIHVTRAEERLTGHHWCRCSSGGKGIVGEIQPLGWDGTGPVRAYGHQIRRMAPRATARRQANCELGTQLSVGRENHGPERPHRGPCRFRTWWGCANSNFGRGRPWGRVWTPAVGARLGAGRHHNKYVSTLAPN